MLSNECLPDGPWSPFVPFGPTTPKIIKRKKKVTCLYNLKHANVYLLWISPSPHQLSALQASISQVGVLLPIVLKADFTHSENKDGASYLLK